MPNLAMRPLLRLLCSPQFPSPVCRLSMLSYKDLVCDSVQLSRIGHLCCTSSPFAFHSNFRKRKEFSGDGSTPKRWFTSSGFTSVAHSCNEEQQSSSRGEMQAVRNADGLLTEAKYEDSETWSRGGGIVHNLAQVDDTVVVEVGAVVHAYAQIGPNSHISSGSIVGAHVVIGSNTRLGFNVSLQNCSVGDSCTLHNGVCVGQDGFGFTINDKGEVVKKPQLLKVQIGSFVEIGANSCVDRGSWRDTVIGDHTKIDNLVQIGHNVVIGRCCLLCGQVGLAGSSTLGDYVVMGGKSGVADHISVASKVRIAAKSAVISHITEPGDYAGFPAVLAKEWRRSMVALRKLGRRGDSEPL
ncbi:hypothetical protein Mapa_012293 [Marchantia paleacea]|nr:hypothetical protein Mapa_012293 [Marchantia paleacea]